MVTKMSALLRSEKPLLLTSLKSDFTPDDTDLLGPLLEIIRIYLELINICEVRWKHKNSVSNRRQEIFYCALEKMPSSTSEEAAP